MKETIGNLIRKAREDKGWNQKELVRRAGCGQSIISDIERDAKPVSAQMAIKLNGLLGIPISVLRGETPTDAAPSSPRDILPPPLFSSLISVVVRSSSLKNLKDLPERRTELIEVPVVSGEIAAGVGQFADDRVEDWAWIPVSQLHGKSRENLVCVKVTGDSMEPGIKAGAMICVDRSDLPQPKKKHPPEAIYAVRHSGNLISVKYVGFTDHIMALMSANPVYLPKQVDLRDNPSPVIGRVVWVWQTV